MEINALWYNALALLAEWLEQSGDGAAASHWRAHAERARRSFNERFCFADGGYLYDVVDGEDGDDPACRPNQVIAIALEYPVLDSERWAAVLGVVRERLLTPFGLRTLAPDHRDYRNRYYGDRRSRDAAYHQGTVWPWLLGPFTDAWLEARPTEHAFVRECLAAFEAHLSEACIGSISEVFDAEAPFTPQGCVTQAWGVAEILRCTLRSAT